MLPIIAEMWAKNHNYHPNTVKDHGDYHRDETGAIINHDQSSFEAYKRQKALAERNLNYEREIQDLKKDVSDIKSLLKDLISKL